MTSRSILFPLVLAFLAAAGAARARAGGGAPTPADPRAAAAAVLDDWHDAAARADEARYFGHFAPDGVFLGTDPGERWTATEFRAWAKPYFARGRAWTFRAHGRHLALSEDGRTAWFDERLATEKMGECRGSGVLTLVGGAWKIALYDLSIPIPNPLTAAVVRLVAEEGRKSPGPP